MEMAVNKAGVGSKVIKFILLITVVGIGLSFFIPALFGIFGPMVRALPFTTPFNYAVADFMGVLALAVIFAVSLFYTIKFSWR